MARGYKRYDILTIRWQKPLLIPFCPSFNSHVAYSEDVQGIRNHWFVLPSQLWNITPQFLSISRLEEME